jgi:hypothetical protein
MTESWKKRWKATPAAAAQTSASPAKAGGGDPWLDDRERDAEIEAASPRGRRRWIPKSIGRKWLKPDR